MTWTAADIERLAAAGAVVLLYLAMCAAIAWSQHRKRSAARREAAALAPVASEVAPWLVAYASQTGTAEQLAWQTARSLHTAGVPVRVVPLSALGIEELRGVERALFIVSTYGEGDPPDAAAPFLARVNALARAPDLARLHHGVLALGDRRYVRFCGFGRALDAWLGDCGATPMFGRVEADNSDQAALTQWRHHLGRLAGTIDLPDWQAPAFEPWQLVAREHLNPGSAGGPTFHLELAPPQGTGLPTWESGDLAQVLAPGDPEHPREYSIASLPADGRLHLLVRQERHADGRLGVASGWLTAQAMLPAEVSLRLRPHRNFRLGDNAARPLILIGNGTGLAGLRGHLKARAAAPGGPGRNWLLFGERHAAHDFYHRAEIESWVRQGVLERADMVFSRDGGTGRRHVQDHLRESADAVRAWLDDGAAVYVCGSLEGMASGVDAALVDIAGPEAVARLAAQGRYRRDVY